MFIGHFAVALAAKRAAPQLSLGTTFLACQWLDLVWPVLVLAGVEKVHVDLNATAFTPLDFEYYPWSHSLLMTLVWSAILGAIIFFKNKSFRSALIIGATVLSHWVLDFISHRPDMPLGLDNSARFGLGLWNSVTSTVLVELILFGLGSFLYLTATRALDRKGKWIICTLLGVLVAIYMMNAFGPKPPLDAPAAMIAGPALAMWLFVAWAAWADAHRAPCC